MNRKGHTSGFTFIEVMVAMLIFTMAVLAAVDVAGGSVRATREARELSRATWLLQGLMTELETKLETDGMDKGCEKKKEGKFDGSSEGFTYVVECYEVDLRLSQAASQLLASQNKDKEENTQTQEDLMKKMILDVASEYMTKAIRELHAEVMWTQGKTKRKVTATTHFVRYDQPLTMPGLSGGQPGGGGTGQ